MAATRQDLEVLKGLLQDVNKQIIAIGKNAEKAFKEVGEPKTLQEIKKTEKSIDELNESTKQLEKTRKDQAKLDQKLTSLKKGEQNEIIKTRLEIQKETKVIKDEIKARQSLTPIYDKQRKRLNQLQKELIEVSLAEGKSSKKARQLGKEVQKLNATISKAEQFSGRFQRNVGNYPKVFNQAVFAIAGGVVGIQGLIRGFGNAIKRYREFEDSNSNLQAVLGVSKEEMTGLRQQSLELGASTSFSAGQVAQLQTELAKLGFPTEDILQMSESTLAAASAMGSGLGETAALTGATLKAFGLDASETSRVNDVLAKSTSASALDFSKLQNSMSTIAPVANSFGFSLEGTTALLGQLSNAGFDASSAATATRNILLNLADANGDLAKSLDEPVKDLPSLVKGLKQLKEDGVDLGEALELTDKRSVAAFSTFLEGTDDVLALNDALEQAAGTAQMMADVQLDNLSGDLKILESAWEGLVLSLLSGDSAFSKVSRTIVQTTTSLLGFLTSQEDIAQVSFETAKALREEADESQNLLNEYESLVQDGIEPTKEEKEKLEIITLQLKDRLGESVIAINEETGAFELNTEAVREQIKAKRLASDAEAATIASRLKGVQEEIKLLEFRTKSEEREIELRRKASDDLGVQEAKKQAQQKASGFLAISNAKLTKEQKEADEALTNALSKGFGTRQELIRQREREAELTEKLKELNFDLNDVDNLFNETIEDQTEILNENTKATEINTKAKDDAAKKSDEAFKIFVANEKRRIELLDEGFLKELEKEELRNKQTIRSAKKNNEDLELVEAIHQKNLEKIRDKFAIEEVDRLEQKTKSTREINTTSGDEALKRLKEEEAERKKEEEDRLKREKEVTEAAVGILERSNEKRKQERLKDLDDEEEGLKNQQSKLEDLAARGDENAVASLALQQKREAEIQRQREREIQRAQRNEIILAGIKTFSDNQDAPKTLAETAALIAGLSQITIPGFWEGADRVGDSLNPQLSGRDGHIVRVDGSEQVYTGSEVSKMKNPLTGKRRTRNEVIDILSLHDKGLTLRNDTLPSLEVKQERFSNNKELLEKVDNLEKAINNLPKNMPTNKAMFNEFYKAFIYTQKTGNKTEQTNYFFD